MILQDVQSVTCETQPHLVTLVFGDHQQRYRAKRCIGWTRLDWKLAKTHRVYYGIKEIHKHEDAIIFFIYKDHSQETFEVKFLGLTLLSEDK